MHYVIGTAGHVDHGKTALIKALTGYDPDRLKEERERGMTTDLGFAFYSENATIIDVPGHEKFIRHMIAGATTIDLVLFTVAANEGVRPQTIEHLEITKLLGIKRGIIVITKIDTVEKEFLEAVKEEIKNLVAESYLAASPIIATSVITGEGIAELKEILDHLIDQAPAKEDRGYFRMPIDRSFKIRGFGQVVAGTILSGSCQIDDNLEISPKGLRIRVRGIEKHKKRVEKAEIGERAAINLIGAEKEEILRGDVLIEPGSLTPTHFLNTYLTAIKTNPFPIKNRMSVKLHIGTKETLARIILLEHEELLPGASGYAQIFTEEMVVSEIGDRFIVRSFSPPLTIGGGKVLELDERKIKRHNPFFLQHLSRLNSEDKKTKIQEIINHRGFAPISEKELGRRVGLSFLNEKLDELKKEGKILWIAGYIATDNYQAIKEKIKQILADFHKKNPLRSGMRISELKSQLEREVSPIVLTKAIKELLSENILTQDKEIIKLAEFKISLSAEERELMVRIIDFLKKEGFSPPDEKGLTNQFPQEKKLAKVITILKETGELVAIENYLFPKETIKKAEEILFHLLKEKGEVTASEYREKLNTTRKYVIPLLNYFDTQGITVRRGDVRILKK
ncbi:MAG: selenocysteine-specific translation elongation factor [candidate division WOR-3 bacterium]